MVDDANVAVGAKVVKAVVEAGAKAVVAEAVEASEASEALVVSVVESKQLQPFTSQ